MPIRVHGTYKNDTGPSDEKKTNRTELFYFTVIKVMKFLVKTTSTNNKTKATSKRTYLFLKQLFILWDKIKKQTQSGLNTLHFISFQKKAINFKL
ncbi:hypothetical protein IW15_17635 [Chryseobacterium soli]|uniref:Uncharacterized protein n=1 Tax=Chryseobacterium soli TaxID=445961 RepID=A0A086A2S6_9FLAO|nr:hypothetical protein IW15_17635 [Chryseobacterium soli]